MTAGPSVFTGPYRGLEPFDESAMAFFFGRERESRLIKDSLFAAALTLLYGVSGVGKSSVLRAGVLPLLRERNSVLPVVYPRFSTASGNRLTVERGWQTDPVSGIKETALLAMRACAENDKQRRQWDKELFAYDMWPLGESLEVIARITDRLVMVILDQFEEYSLYHPSDNDLFAQQFPKALSSRNRSIAFLISLREDSLAKLDRFKTTIPSLWDSYRRIDHLDWAAGEDAIRKPLEEYNRRLEPGKIPVRIEDELVRTVLDQVRTGKLGVGNAGSGTIDNEPSGPHRIETPYLQLVMMRLWELDGKSDLLRASTLKKEKNAENIVLTHLDRVMSDFSASERELAGKVFDRLVTPGGSKIAFSVADLAKYEMVSEGVLRPILQRLEEGDRRILRKVADPRKPQAEPLYEIFHDRLGKAMLEWRTNFRAQQQRDAAARQQLEQKRLEEESLRAVRSRIDGAMETLGPRRQRIWAAIMFFLVNSKGVRQPKTLSELSGQSGTTAAATERVLSRLVESGVLRHAFSDKRSVAEPAYEIVDDLTAAALLEWHSTYTTSRQPTHEDATTTTPPPAGPGTETNSLSSFPYPRMRELLFGGKVVPYLGSGVTLSLRRQDDGGRPVASPMSTRDLKEAMATQCDYPATEFESSDVAEVASFFVQRLGRPALDRLLNQLIGGDDLEPSETHKYLAEAARTQPLMIMTTNYDRLMERALDLADVEYDVLAYLPDDEDRRDCLGMLRHGSSKVQVGKAQAFKLDRDRTLVFRLNGAGLGGPYPYVSTEEDQIDWLLRLRGRESWLSSEIAARLERAPLLSLGHGGRDWSQRALWRTLSDRKLRNQSWAVSLHPSPLSVMTWQRYEVQILNEDLNTWTQRMRELGGSDSPPSNKETVAPVQKLKQKLKRLKGQTKKK